MNKYRAVPDGYGWEVQFKSKCSWFWHQCSRFGGAGVNHCTSLEEARMLAELHAKMQHELPIQKPARTTVYFGILPSSDSTVEK